MADAGDSKSPAPRGHAGSIPASGTTIQAGSFEVGRGGRQEPFGTSCLPLALGEGFRLRESFESSAWAWINRRPSRSSCHVEHGELKHGVPGDADLLRQGASSLPRGIRHADGSRSGLGRWGPLFRAAARAEKKRRNIRTEVLLEPGGVGSLRAPQLLERNVDRGGFREGAVDLRLRGLHVGKVRPATVPSAIQRPGRSCFTRRSLASKIASTSDGVRRGRRRARRSPETSRTSRG